MTASQHARSADVVSFDVGLSDDWYQIPLGDDSESEGWAASLTARLDPGTAASELLSYQLERVRQNLLTSADPTMTAMVWIPLPQTGYAACALGFKLEDLDDSVSADAVLADLEADRDRRTDAYEFLEVETWRGEIEAGEFVAARNVLVHHDDASLEGTVEEQTVFAVFPPDANQMVQFVFSAESIGAFYDMPAQTQSVVSTLRTKLEAIV